MHPLLWIVGLFAGGAVIKSVLSSSESTSAPAVKIIRSPEHDEIDRLINAADNYSALIDKSAFTPTMSPYDMDAAIKAARAAQSKAEADMRKQYDKWAGEASTYVAKTGVGIVLIPFIYLGAQMAKLSQEIAKKVFYTDGWAQKWIDIITNDQGKLTASGIPFRRFVKKFDNSPMGYWAAGGGNEATEGRSSTGLANLMHEWFDGRMLNDAQRKAAHEGFARMRDGAKDGNNPFAIAAYMLVQAIAPVDWTQDAYDSYVINSTSYRNMVESMNGKTKPDWWPSDGYPFERVTNDTIRFWHMLVAAVSTANARAYGIPFEYWKDMVGAGWSGWNEGVAAVEKAESEGAGKFKANWYVPGKGALGFAMASMRTMEMANAIRKSMKLAEIK